MAAISCRFQVFVSTVFLLGAILRTAAALDVRRDMADILPPAALRAPSDHPLDAKIGALLKSQAAAGPFRPSGIAASDYLRIIDRQVAVFRCCQDAAGAIIDPVMKIEWQYSTPCYALSVAVVHASGYNADAELLASGIRAMDCSVDQIHEYRCAHNHGEFFIQPVMLALDLYARLVPAQKLAEWREKLSGLDPYKLYPDNLRRRKTIYNHNVVALADGYDIRTVQELLGHSDVKTTMIYTHVLNRGGRGVRSPADGLAPRPEER